MKNSKGSTLLEVLVSLALVLFVVTALTITTINGLKNSQLSQNQLQATKYAQEGVEQIKQARERNCKIFVTGESDPYVWYGPGQSIWNRSLGATDFKLNVSGTECNLNQVNSEETIVSKFSRKITLQDDGSNSDRKKVTVKVSWTDFSGAHKSELITILSEDY